MAESRPETDIVEVIIAEAARYHRRFDSLERSMLAMQTGFRHEMREAISMSDKNMTKAMSELSKKLEVSVAETKTDMQWLKRISLVILGVLAALLIQSFS